MTTDQTPTTDSERVAQIRARVNAATDGPWVTHDVSETKGEEPYYWVWQESKLPYYGAVFLTGDPCEPHGSIGEVPVAGATGNAQENANSEYIAHSRQDIPFLLDLVATQAATLERVRDLHAGEVLSAGEVSVKVCPTCDDAIWPCKTAATLDAALSSQQTQMTATASAEAVRVAAAPLRAQQAAKRALSEARHTPHVEADTAD